MLKKLYIFSLVLFFVAGTQLVTPQSFPLPEVLYYTFDEAGSDSTQNFAVPGRGDVWAQVMGALTLGGAGQFGSALVGGGGSSSSDYVNTGWITDIGDSPWTIGMWLNDLVDLTTIHYIFGDNTAGSFSCFYNGAAPTGGILLRGPSMTEVPVNFVQPGPAVVHFVYDTTGSPTILAYLNGAIQTGIGQAGPLNINGTAPFKVGGYSTLTGLEAGGLLDEFRFYDRALDATEVAATWNISIVPVGLTSFTVIPDVYSLHQNYPNPFNPNTNITFTLAANAQVTLKVFDILGQEVMTLINQDLTAGVHTYDFDAAGFNSGVYFYRIEANGIEGTNFTLVKKMILTK